MPLVIFTSIKPAMDGNPGRFMKIKSKERHLRNFPAIPKNETPK